MACSLHAFVIHDLIDGLVCENAIFKEWVKMMAENSEGVFADDACHSFVNP